MKKRQVKMIRYSRPPISRQWDTIMGQQGFQASKTMAPFAGMIPEQVQSSGLNGRRIG